MTHILYVTLGYSDLARTVRFYDAVLPPLDMARMADVDDGWLGYGPDYDHGVGLYLCPPFDGRGPTPGNGAMVAIRATSAAQVRTFHAAALAHGGTDEGPPIARPHYEAGFYAAYVRDPDGNKLACVWHRWNGTD